MKKFLFILSISLFTISGFTQGIVNSGAYIFISSGATVYVDGGTSGNYTSSGTSFIKSTSGLSTLAVEGNFTNNSTTNAIDGVAYSKILLAGGVQSIDGSKTSVLGTVESAGSGAKTISTKQQISKLVLNGQNVTFSDTVRVLGRLTLTSGALTTAGKLILRSTVDSTAMLTEVTGGTVSGDAIVERYIPGGSTKRKWRFLSSPVNTDGTNSLLSQYIDDIHVTGIGTGFDACSGCTPSIRTYNEATSGAASLGWTNPDNITNPIAKGTGVEVFVRGSRSLANPFLNWTSPDNVTIDFIGALNTGSVVKSVSFNNSNTATADGFNLVGNPYASPINWASNTGWTKTNLSPWMYIYSAKSASYNYINEDGVTLIGSDNDKSAIVPSGQAFFVKATTTGASLTFTEAVKATTTPFNFFRGMASKPTLKYTLNFNNEKIDEALIGFDNSATLSGTDVSEAVKFYNDKINLYSISTDGIALAVNYRPAPTALDTIRIAVWDYDSTNIEVGNHLLKFDSLNTLTSFDVYLIDKYTSTTINLKNQNTYHFDISTDANSYGNNRFVLVFDASTGIDKRISNTLISVYPNPANNELHIKSFNTEYANSNTLVSIRNLVGQTVFTSEAQSLKNFNTLDIASLEAGVYIIEVRLEGQSIFQKFIKR